MRANQRVSVSRCLQGPASIALCLHRDLPLPRPLKGTMLSSKPRGSGECRVKAKDVASFPHALRSLVKLQRGDDP